MRPYAAFLFPVLLFHGAVNAGQLELSGQFSQGGMIQGQTDPGTRVVYQGKNVLVSPQGIFIVGFGRDEASPTEISATFGDGSTTTRQIDVAPRDYDIQRIDGLDQKKVTPPKETLERIAAENAMVGRARRKNDPRPDFLAGFIWPAKGIISGVYGSQRVLNGQPRRPHFGVDVAAPTGSPVYAPAPGVVTLAHPDMYFSGGTLIIDHGHNLTSSFLHLSRIVVQVGDRVQQGDKIAEIGATGRVTGPHLDWRMNLLGKRIDPQLLVPEPKPDPAQ